MNIMDDFMTATVIKVEMPSETFVYFLICFVKIC